MAISNREALKQEFERRKQRKELFNVSDSYEWIMKNGFTNENGVKMEFDDRSFLVQPLQDESKLLAVLKCSQVGFSTISIFKSAYMAIKYGYNIIYTLPTDSDVEEFNKAKTNRIYDNNPTLKGFLTDDSLHTKGFRTLAGDNVGFIFSKGTYGRSASIMQTADILIKDEFDRSNANVLNAYKSRITASVYGAEWEFSNPTFPGFGVDHTYQLSDQKHFIYWCTKCGHASYITFDAEGFDGGNTHHVCKDRNEFVCGSCNDILDRRHCDTEWVSKYPSKLNISGYWISQMMAPWITAEKLLREKQLTYPDVWDNFFMGRPYASNSNTLDPSNIIKNIQYDEKGYVKRNDGKYRVLGADVGGTIDNPHFHCVMGTEQGLTEIIKIQGEEALHNYMRMNNISMIVADNAPYPELTTRLSRAFPGKVWRCVFDYNANRKELYETDYKTRIVNVHRTRLFDRVVDGYITGERRLFIDPLVPTLSSMVGGSESLCRHWKSQRKVGTSGETKQLNNDNKDLKFDKLGDSIPMWINDGPDHFSLADIYNCLAQQIILKHMEGVA